MQLKIFARILLTLALSACNQGNDRGEKTAMVAPWTGPWLFWEGQLRVHALQGCQQKVQISSADIWQQGQVDLPCDKNQKIALNTTIENQHNVANLTQWLALPSSDYAQWRAALQTLAIINEHEQWQWGNGRVVLMAGALSSDAKALDALWRWHQLDMQAQTQGGAVQVLLNREDIAALAGDARFNLALTGSLQQLKISVTDAFGLNSEWGRWLRQQSVALKYNEVLLSNVAWTANSLNYFADIDSVASTLRMGLHTRFRLYSDAQVAELYAQIDAEPSAAITLSDWQALQEQWQVKQWLSQSTHAVAGITQVKDAAWLWQNGELKKIER